MQMDPCMQEIFDHASEAYPEECCGVVTAAGVVVRLRNVASNPRKGFRISPNDYLMYCTGAMFVYHSHPDGVAVFSEMDQEFHRTTRIPLLVVAWPTGEIRLLGDPGADKSIHDRPFIYGVFDCYTTPKDFYKRQLGIDLPQITRPRFGSWQSKGIDPFVEGIVACGMDDCETLEYGDVLIFSFHRNKVANHLGVYTGNSKFLHHGMLAFSNEVTYDKRYRDATVRTLRHVTRN